MESHSQENVINAWRRSIEKPFPFDTGWMEGILWGSALGSRHYYWKADLCVAIDPCDIEKPSHRATQRPHFLQFWPILLSPHGVLFYSHTDQTQLPNKCPLSEKRGQNCEGIRITEESETIFRKHQLRHVFRHSSLIGLGWPGLSPPSDSCIWPGPVQVLLLRVPGLQEVAACSSHCTRSSQASVAPWQTASYITGCNSAAFLVT